MNRQEATELYTTLINDLVDHCPHCDAKTHLKVLFSDSYLTSGSSDLVFYSTFRCVPCKSLVLKTYEFTQNPYTQSSQLSVTGWTDKYPSADIASTTRYDAHVPAEALKDFKEGVSCLSQGSYRAAVAMFRRALQSALLERGADEKKDLMDQIAEADCLTQDIKDWAHNIRIFGNWGAHPQSDNLKLADEKVAEEARAFLEEFFNYVYVMPSRVATARKKNKPTSEEGGEPHGDSE